MTEELKKVGPGIDLEANRVRFDYIKSNFFRVVHIDGAFGGISPRGDHILMTVWNERGPIPKQTVHEISDSGVVGQEIMEDRITREAIVREVETQLVMDISVAEQVVAWLNVKIELAKESSGSEEKDK